MKKGYMIREGYYYTNWEITDKVVFPTKKALHKYMKNTHDYGFTKKRNDGHVIYSNDRKEHGYTIEKVHVYEKGEIK